MDRLDRERSFHNEVFTDLRRKKLAVFYKAARESAAFFEKLVLASPPDSRFLDYGCGRGDFSLFLASNGFHVVGIDISDSAAQIATERAALANLPNTLFRRMNAEQLEFPDASFDVVCGRGVLHHLDLNTAYREIARVLKPGGKGLFIEPLGHNPAINLFRRLTPRMRSVDEHPLLVKDLELASDYFDDVTVTYFHLFSVAGFAVPFALPILQSVDRILINHIEALRPYCWQVVMQLTRA